MTRCCVIRDGEELYLAFDDLTAAERADIEQRRKSPLARRRFGVGGDRNRTVSIPANAVASIEADEPVKSSP